MSDLTDLQAAIGELTTNLTAAEATISTLRKENASLREQEQNAERRAQLRAMEIMASVGQQAIPADFRSDADQVKPNLSHLKGLDRVKAAIGVALNR